MSFPGGPALGGRLFGEIGAERTGFAPGTRAKAYAGTAPVTRFSGTKVHIAALRMVRTKRLNHAAYLWALPLILHSADARAHYDHRRLCGDSHTAASRSGPIRLHLDS